MRDMKHIIQTALLPVCLTTAIVGPSGQRLSAQAAAGNATVRSEVKVLRFGKLWDGSKVIADAVVVVEGDRVKSVGSGGAAPAGSPTIDLSKFYGIPGLIDTHTHITYWAEARPRPGVRPLQASTGLPTAVRVFMAQENARKALEAGVTAVRDLGAQEYADLAMRDLINPVPASLPPATACTSPAATRAPAKCWCPPAERRTAWPK